MSNRLQKMVWLWIFECKVSIVLWRLTCLSFLSLFDDKPLSLILLRSCGSNAVVSATNHFSCQRYLFLKTPFPILFNSFSFSFFNSFSLLPVPQDVRYSKEFLNCELASVSLVWSYFFLEYDSFLCLPNPSFEKIMSMNHYTSIILKYVIIKPRPNSFNLFFI